MAVSTSIYQELLFLGSSVLVGMGLFFLYDILRIFRRILPHGNIWIGVEDFLYWIIFTGVVFVLLYPLPLFPGSVGSRADPVP